MAQTIGKWNPAAQDKLKSTAQYAFSFFTQANIYLAEILKRENKPKEALDIYQKDDIPNPVEI